jgi:hypothetical protein
MSIKGFMAKRCDGCALCRYARSNPESMVGRLMHWHGKFCPFWRAWEAEYGGKEEPSAKQATSPGL